MGFGFRKSFRLGSGVRLNLSKRGAGLGFGGKGASFSIGPSGRRTTISAPGTGLSYTTLHGRSRGGSGIGSTILGFIIIAAVLVWLFG